MKNAVNSSSLLRCLAFAVSLAGTLFWLYTFYAIAQVPPGDGTGFQWVAVMPLGTVFVALTLPAFMLTLPLTRSAITA